MVLDGRSSMPARPTTSRSSGSRCSRSRRLPSSCMRRSLGSSARCVKGSVNSSASKARTSMNRRRFLSSTASLGLGLVARPYVARAAAKEILVAEPVHSTGYLPLYIAMAKGFFDEANVAVNLVTIETGGGHTHAVLSRQALAFIGGPEHNAFAKAKGAELRAVVHYVDRGTIYFCAAQGFEPPQT